MCILVSVSNAQSVLWLRYNEIGQLQERSSDELFTLLENQINFTDRSQSQMSIIDKDTSYSSYVLKTVVKNTMDEKIVVEVYAWVENSTKVLKLANVYVGHEVKNDTQTDEYSNYYNIVKGMRDSNCLIDADSKLIFYDITTNVTCCPAIFQFYEKTFKERMQFCIFDWDDARSCKQQYDYCAELSK